jgi:hypothetical protein
MAIYLRARPNVTPKKAPMSVGPQSNDILFSRQSHGLISMSLETQLGWLRPLPYDAGLERENQTG